MSITKNQTYDQALAAINADMDNDVFACVATWPDTGLYIGLNAAQGNALWIWDATSSSQGSAYSPSDSDKIAINWQYGGDKPPR